MFNSSELQEHLDSLDQSLIESVALKSDLVTQLASELSELAIPVFDAAPESKPSASIDSAKNEVTDDDLGIFNSIDNFGLQLNDSILGNQDSFKSLTSTLEAGNYIQDQVSNTSGSVSGATFDSVYGYGLVDAAAAVAAAVGQYPFPEVQDLGGYNWGNDLVGAPEAWAQGYTGQGVTVAVIDSGVDITHEDLSGNIWQNSDEIFGNGFDDDNNGYTDDTYGWNFASSNSNVMPDASFMSPGTPFETALMQAGHGTHVAGTIAGLNNGFGVTGVAYDAEIMPIKLADVNENGQHVKSGSLAEAIYYAVNNGAEVINMSIGGPGFASPDVLNALAYAESYNVVTVAAAGNTRGAAGSLSPMYPAAFATEYGLSVGAVDSSGIMAEFSHGASSDSSMQHVVAPGVDILSTLPDNNYGSSDGTSMAAPHVAGVAALMLGANPYLTADQVCQVLTVTATSLGGSSSSIVPSVDLLSTGAGF